MTDIRAQLLAYTPCNAQEQRDRAIMLAGCDAPDIFSRSNPQTHFTASAWLVDAERRAVLMAYHNQYDSWSWLGGHADGERDLPAVARREVWEESGVLARPLSEAIYSLEIITVEGHEKRGVYVSAHLHWNITYLLTADKTVPLRVKPDENSAVRWFSPDEAVAASTEPKMQIIYRKLNDKLKGVCDAT